VAVGRSGRRSAPPVSGNLWVFIGWFPIPFDL
jgi:hypothetical protein